MTPLIALLLAIASDAQRSRTQELSGRLGGGRRPPETTPLGRRALFALKQSSPYAFWTTRAFMQRDLPAAREATISSSDAAALESAGAPLMGDLGWNTAPGLLSVLPWFMQQVERDLGAESAPGNDYIERLSQEGVTLPEMFSLGYQGTRIVQKSTEARINLRHLLDWFQSEQPDLGGMSIADAAEAADRWSQKSKGITGPRDSLRGEVIRDWGDGWTANKLTSRRQLDWEGDQQSHCVGSYASQVRGGDIEIISLRHDGQPVLTLEVRLDEDGDRESVVQIKGSHNRSPGSTGGNYVEGEVDKLVELAEELTGEDFGDPRVNPEAFISMGQDHIIEAIRNDPTLLSANESFAQRLYHGGDDGDGIYELYEVAKEWARLVESGKASWFPPEIAAHQIHEEINPDLSKEEREIADLSVGVDAPPHAWGRRQVPQWVVIPSITHEIATSWDGGGGDEDIPISLIQWQEEIPLENGEKLVVVFEGLIYYSGDAYRGGGEWNHAANSASAIISPDGDILRSTSNWPGWRFHAPVDGWDYDTQSADADWFSPEPAEIRELLEAWHDYDGRRLISIGGARSYAESVRAIAEQMKARASGETGIINMLGTPDEALEPTLDSLNKHGITRQQLSDRTPGQIIPLPVDEDEQAEHLVALQDALSDTEPVILAWQTSQLVASVPGIDAWRAPAWNLVAIQNREPRAQMALTTHIPQIGIISPGWIVGNVEAIERGKGWGTMLYAAAVHLVGGVEGVGIISAEVGGAKVSDEAIAVRDRLSDLMKFKVTTGVLIPGDEQGHVQFSDLNHGYASGRKIPVRIHGPGELPVDVWIVTAEQVTDILSEANEP